MAEAVFIDRSRLAPLLDRFAEEVGRLRDDDSELRLLHAVRTDWALCEADLDGKGDTWVLRAARGEIAGVDPAMARTAATSLASVYEVRPHGTQTWLHDPLHGTWFRLLDAVDFADAPNALVLWELRIIPDEAREGVHMVRDPLPYPKSLVRELERTHAERFVGRETPSLQQLRKARLHWARSGERFWRV